MRAAAASLLVLAIGCADETGRYDVTTVLELARSRGDARGSTHTGTWIAEVNQRSCDCPPFSVSEVVLLDLGDATFTGVGIAYPMIEADGVARMNAGGFELLGPVDDDGALRLGAVVTQMFFVVRTEIVARFDGTIVDTTPPLQLGEAFAELDGEMVVRFGGTAPETKIACDAEYDVTAELFIAPPPP